MKEEDIPQSKAEYEAYVDGSAKFTTHLCETCKNKDECSTCGEIDNFDEVLAVLAEHKNDEDIDVVLTAIVVRCAKYEKEEA